jgi:hypothetical protein
VACSRGVTARTAYGAGVVKVLVSPEAAEYVHGHGGSLFVWATVASCCTGALTFLEASTESPGADHAFRRVWGDGFHLFIDVGRRALPDRIDVELKGWRRRRIRAYWNGCAYALD